ncbi:hypothetical protein I317_02071 [Kwoniella heveanensis CBS 569]|nr:hypothetical protein I317_02071 [Kwoniella heveanensis CBS 569]
MPGRFLLRRARSGVEKLKGSSSSSSSSSMCDDSSSSAKSQDPTSSCPPAPLLEPQPTFVDSIVPATPPVEVKIACTTGPSQLRSVLPALARRPKSTESLGASSPTTSSVSGSDGDSDGSLKPLFTTTVLVLPPSPRQPASSPFLHEDNEEAESESDASSDNIDLPFSLEEDDHTTPCHSMLATPVFPSPAHSSHAHSRPHSYSDVATIGSSSCECDPECIDPSLCTSFFSIGSSYHHPLYAAAASVAGGIGRSGQYDFQPPASEASYRYINLSQYSSSSHVMMKREQEHEDEHDMTCSWAASPPETGCSWAVSPPTHARAFATAAASPSSFEDEDRSASYSYTHRPYVGPSSYASSTMSNSSSSDDDDRELHSDDHEVQEDDDEYEDEHYAVRSKPARSGKATPSLAGLLEQCGSLMDPDNRPSLSSFKINMNHPSSTPTSTHPEQDTSSILPKPSNIPKRHSVKVVERGFHPVRSPISSVPAMPRTEESSRRLSIILEA